MTDQEILDFIRKDNPNGTERDVKAMRKFMCALECEDSTTPEEAHRRICASLDMLIEEMRRTESREAQARLVVARLGRFIIK